MYKNTNQDDRYFRISHLYIAAFLFSKGLELSGIERSDDHKSIFIFKDTPDREFLVQSFNYSPVNDPSVLVDARTFMASLKAVKDRLYQLDT